MLNTDYNQKFGKEGLTFDDVLLIPGESHVEPKNVQVTTNLTKTIRLNTPLMTAAMDTVTETAMAIAIAREGGVGIIHKNMAIEKQADMVDRVKRSENGVIVNPFFLSPDNTVRDADALMGKYKISGVPICRDGKLVGIITNRDLRFMTAEDFNQKISKVMTSEDLVTAPVGTTMEQAQEILRHHKIEKLPIVGSDGSLMGLITIKDIEKSVQYPNSQTALRRCHRRHRRRARPRGGIAAGRCGRGRARLRARSQLQCCQLRCKSQKSISRFAARCRQYRYR